MSIKARSKFTVIFVGRSYEKKPRCGRGWWRPSAWMAATPGAFAGGGGGDCAAAAAASSTRTTTAEVRTGHRSPCSIWHFPPCSPTSTANRHFGQNANMHTPGGARSRCSPDCSASCERENTVPSRGPRPLLECHLRTFPFLTSNPVFQVILLWLF